MQNKNDIKKLILSLSLINNESSDEHKIKILYTLSNKIENHYREFKIKKKNGNYRVLREPSPFLKDVQKNILNNYLYHLEPSEYVTSYIKGKSLKDNAKIHVGKKIVLKLDIKSFFDNIDFLTVYNKVFGIDKLPKQVGFLLTSLCCYYGSIPQGAPTSAYISNLILKDFDNTLGSWCQEQNISYTRYSDDMTFSGDFHPNIVIKKVKELLKEYHLNINREKIHVIGKSSSQTVTGICVNEKMQVPKNYRKKIRQEMYYIKKFGIDEHLDRVDIKVNKQKYLMSLYGKILFVLNIDSSSKEFIEYKNIIRKILNIT